MSENARVFISCGQRREANLGVINQQNLQLYTMPELSIAKEVSLGLEKLGFIPYIALEQQTLEGVKEGIFNHLQKSEYFLFIDFKRERLLKYGSSDFLTEECRGSLFSHQELAIATFLGYDVLAFQEEGLKKDDGILQFIQANCITFDDRKKLVNLILDKVKEKWANNWRNELRMDIASSYVDAQAEWGKSRFYHFDVLNKHKDKIARNCLAYVEKIRNIQTNKTSIPEFVELKWRGVKSQSVSIPPKSSRKLDAFHVDFKCPNKVKLGINTFITDWLNYVADYSLEGLGDYEVDYVLFSDDFQSIRSRYLIHVGKRIEEVTIKEIQ